MQTAPIPPSKQTLQILWFAMVAALGPYWFVRLVAANRPVQPDTQVLSMALAGLSVAMFAVAAAWWRWRGAAFEARTTPTALLHLTREQRTALALQAQATVIVALAVLETPVIFGLINGFVGGPVRYLFECNALAALFGMIWLRLHAFPSVLPLFE